MIRLKSISFVAAIAALAACSKTPAPSVTDAGPAARAPAAAPEPPPKEYQRVVYRCPDGKDLVLKLYDDQRARVDIDGAEQVLRPVATDDGTLFLGDEVNVRIVGQQATASRAGVVLMAGCKVQPAP